METKLPPLAHRFAFAIGFALGVIAALPELTTPLLFRLTCRPLMAIQSSAYGRRGIVDGFEEGYDRLANFAARVRLAK